MNAEHGRNYDIQKLVNWVFARSNARPTKIMISGEQWGGQDVGGLMGFTIPNTGADVRGYAFSMNTFATAMPMVPARALRGPLQPRHWQMDAQCRQRRSVVLCR